MAKFGYDYPTKISNTKFTMLTPSISHYLWNDTRW